MYALAIFVETYQTRINQDNKNHYPETVGGNGLMGQFQSENSLSVTSNMALTSEPY